MLHLKLELKLELRASWRKYERFWPNLVLSIYRQRDDRDHATYGYVGCNRRSPWKFGRHVDSHGRVYRYVGPVTLFQDIWPAPPAQRARPY